jgi:hypothetical protein
MRIGQEFADEIWEENEDLLKKLIDIMGGYATERKGAELNMLAHAVNVIARVSQERLRLDPRGIEKSP